MEFCNPPKYTLTDEQTLNFTSPEFVALMSGPDRFNVKSPLLCAFMDELEKSGYVYNATAIKAWHDHCGVPVPTEHWREGTPLSALVYNCQQFRRHDKLVRDGYTPGTQAMLEQCLATGEHIAFPGGDSYKVREVNGKPHAMLPRSRTRCASVIGNPCKIIPTPKKDVLSHA